MKIHIRLSKLLNRLPTHQLC